MRINQFVARATGASRHAADRLIGEGRVAVNGEAARPGVSVSPSDTVTLDDGRLHLPDTTRTIMLNKPLGYVCSRDGQGSPTVYDLLPAELRNLKTAGRLDKDSSGLILLTNDGNLANSLTHPRYAKEKIYQVTLDKSLDPEDADRLGKGVDLEDGPSRLKISDVSGKDLTVRMSEGRNRQIRRTFAALGYEVIKLRRTAFGDYSLGSLPEGRYNSL